MEQNNSKQWQLAPHAMRSSGILGGWCPLLVGTLEVIETGENHWPAPKVKTRDSGWQWLNRLKGLALKTKTSFENKQCLHTHERSIAYVLMVSIFFVPGESLFCCTFIQYPKVIDIAMESGPFIDDLWWFTYKNLVISQLYATNCLGYNDDGFHPIPFKSYLNHGSDPFTIW